MKAFLLVAICILGLGCYYVGSRLISATSLNLIQKRWLWGLWIACLALQIIGPILYRQHIETKLGVSQRAFQTLIYGALGFASLLLFGALLIDIWKAVSLATGFSAERRQLIIDGIAALTTGLAGVASAHGITSLRHAPAVRKVSIPVASLHTDLIGFRLVQLTDVHIGPTLPSAYLAECVEAVNALKPDLIAITGDLVDASVAQVGEEISVLSKLNAKHGVFFVTGNHEYYWGRQAWAAFLRGLGITVLQNDGKLLRHGNASLGVAGVNDYSASRFGDVSEPAVAKKAVPSADFSILLAHQPKSCEAAAEAGFPLQISGHTHGGQYYPFRFIVRLFQPYLDGLYRHKEMWLYVSRGTGYWGPPLRIGVPREISLIELTRG